MVVAYIYRYIYYIKYFGGLRRAPNISRRVFMSRGGSRGVVICIYIYLTLNSGGYIHTYIHIYTYFIEYVGGLETGSQYI